ncbi:hypothetical protein LTR85_001243 [Meristemomyces frigidus]|nr:hypothetical protein LTR85_001243 [Meristemomyces frigidus]
MVNSSLERLTKAKVGYHAMADLRHDASLWEEADLRTTRIWQRIFFFAVDGNELQAWTQLRRVCRAAKDGVEEGLGELVLRDPLRVRIHFQCGHLPNPRGPSPPREMEMVFSHLCPEEHTRCVFKESKRSAQAYLGEGRSRASRRRHEMIKHAAWRKNTDVYLGAGRDAGTKGGRFDIPPFHICIAGMVNDTELPGLKMDYTNRTISFKRLGLFRAFFREAIELKERTQQQQPVGSGNWASAQAFNRDDDPRELHATQHRRALRRVRIKRVYKERSNVEYNVESWSFQRDEMGALKKSMEREEPCRLEEVDENMFQESVRRKEAWLRYIRLYNGSESGDEQ